MTSKLIWVPRGLLRTFSGNLSSTDLLKSNEEVCSDQRFVDLEYIINDFTHVTGWKNITYFEEQQAARSERLANVKHIPKVALVNPDGSVLDMVLNCNSLIKKESVESFVFPSIQDAYHCCREAA